MKGRFMEKLVLTDLECDWPINLGAYQIVAGTPKNSVIPNQVRDDAVFFKVGKSIITENSLLKIVSMYFK